MTEEVEKKYHRFRHRPGGWSCFDLIEECTKPKPCIGCMFDHAFTTKDGIPLDREKAEAEMARERERFGHLPECAGYQERRRGRRR